MPAAHPDSQIARKDWMRSSPFNAGLGYVRYDRAEAREAINHLDRNELRWFQNLFLPSVKLACKERVGSRLRRPYQAPQTPRQRLVASGGRRCGEAGGAAATAQPPRSVSALGNHGGPAEEDLHSQPGGPRALDDARSPRARLGRCRGRDRACRSGRQTAAAWLA